MRWRTGARMVSRLLGSAERVKAGARGSPRPDEPASAAPPTSPRHLVASQTLRRSGRWTSSFSSQAPAIFSCTVFCRSLALRFLKSTRSSS